jgi:hypothetical protein
MPLVRANGVEQPIVLSESRKDSQLNIPMPIPTAYGDQRTARNHSMRFSSPGIDKKDLFVQNLIF